MGWPSLGPCIGSVRYDAIGSVCYCTWHHMVCALSLEPSRTFFKERSGISDWSRSGEGHVRVVEHVINHMHGHVRDHVGDTWYVSWSHDLLVIVANTVCHKLGPKQTQKIAAKDALHQWVHFKIQGTGSPGELPGRESRNPLAVPPWPTKEHPGRSNERRSASHLPRPKTTSSRSSPVQTNNWQHCPMEGSPPPEPLSK